MAAIVQRGAVVHCCEVWLSGGLGLFRHRRTGVLKEFKALGVIRFKWL